jgi:hypothetical protein
MRAGCLLIVKFLSQTHGSNVHRIAYATEAPAGFKTPTLSKCPGSKSVSNGIPEPPNDTFALEHANFESREGNDSGLGPVHNATICADCHQGTGIGGPSQVTEVRAGHLDAKGNFVNPTIFINHGKDMGRSSSCCCRARSRVWRISFSVPAEQGLRPYRLDHTLYLRVVPNRQLTQLA